MGREGEGRGREAVHNLRKTTPPRHQMAGYGPDADMQPVPRTV